jgi:hypothetical protein
MYVHDDRREQLASWLLERLSHERLVVEDGADQPRAEIRLHDAVREADAVRTRLDEAQRGAARRRQADVDAHSPERVEPREERVDQRTLAQLAHLVLPTPVGRRRRGRRRLPSQTLMLLNRLLDVPRDQVLVGNLQRVLREADAGERRELLDRRLALACVERLVGVEVPPDEAVDPGLQQAQAQRDAVHAARVEPSVLAARVRVL